MVPVIRGGLLLALLSACSARPHLPSVSEEFRRLDNTLTFELPDTGGYLVNSTPLDTARLAQLYHSVFDERLPNLRAAFVIDNPRRPWSDVEFLLVKARAAGVQLFDAERSGRLLRGSFKTVVAPDSAR